MARLLDQRSAITMLESDGWRRTVGGKHAVKMVKEGARPITLPAHRGEPYGKSLTSAIVKQAGIDKETAWNSPSRHMPRARATGPRSSSSRDALPPPER